jgi:hypothetical protein
LYIGKLNTYQKTLNKENAIYIWFINFCIKIKSMNIKINIYQLMVIWKEEILHLKNVEAHISQLYICFYFYLVFLIKCYILILSLIIKQLGNMRKATMVNSYLLPLVFYKHKCLKMGTLFPPSNNCIYCYNFTIIIRGKTWFWITLSIHNFYLYLTFNYACMLYSNSQFRYKYKFCY